MKRMRKLLDAARRARMTRRTFRYRLAGTIGVAAVFFALMGASAQAFYFEGGTAAQQAYVTKVIEACTMPYTTTETELRAFGPVRIRIVPMSGISGYSEPGHVYINEKLQPGASLGEIAAHEWAHQIWYSLGPKWWAKWADECNAGSPTGDNWHDNPRENFAECAKVTFWDGQYLLRNYAATDLKVVSPAEIRAWLNTARYANKCPFTDLSPTVMSTNQDQDELAAAGGYVQQAGIMQGVSDTEFDAGAQLTKRQLAQICQRAGLSCPVDWIYNYDAATRGDIHETIPSLSFSEGRWSEPITRGQMARLVWRSR